MTCGVARIGEERCKSADGYTRNSSARYGITVIVAWGLMRGARMGAEQCGTLMCQLLQPVDERGSSRSRPVPSMCTDTLYI